MEYGVFYALLFQGNSSIDSVKEGKNVYNSFENPPPPLQHEVRWGEKLVSDGKNNLHDTIGLYMSIRKVSGKSFECEKRKIIKI